MRFNYESVVKIQRFDKENNNLNMYYNISNPSNKSYQYSSTIITDKSINGELSVPIVTNKNLLNLDNYNMEFLNMDDKILNSVDHVSYKKQQSNHNTSSVIKSDSMTDTEDSDEIFFKRANNNSHINNNITINESIHKHSHTKNSHGISFISLMFQKNRIERMSRFSKLRNGDCRDKESVVVNNNLNLHIEKQCNLSNVQNSNPKNSPHIIDQNSIFQNNNNNSTIFFGLSDSNRFNESNYEFNSISNIQNISQTSINNFYIPMQINDSFNSTDSVIENDDISTEYFSSPNVNTNESFEFDSNLEKSDSNSLFDSMKLEDDQIVQNSLLLNSQTNIKKRKFIQKFDVDTYFNKKRNIYNESKETSHLNVVKPSFLQWGEDDDFFDDIFISNSGQKRLYSTFSRLSIRTENKKRKINNYFSIFNSFSSQYLASILCEISLYLEDNDYFSMINVCMEWNKILEGNFVWKSKLCSLFHLKSLPKIYESDTFKFSDSNINSINNNVNTENLPLMQDEQILTPEIIDNDMEPRNLSFSSNTYKESIMSNVSFKNLYLKAKKQLGICYKCVSNTKYKNEKIPKTPEERMAYLNRLMSSTSNAIAKLKLESNSNFSNPLSKLLKFRIKYNTHIINTKSSTGDDMLPEKVFYFMSSVQVHLWINCVATFSTSSSSYNDEHTLSLNGIDILNYNKKKSNLNLNLDPLSWLWERLCIEDSHLLITKEERFKWGSTDASCPLNLYMKLLYSIVEVIFPESEGMKQIVEGISKGTVLNYSILKLQWKGNPLGIFII